MPDLREVAGAIEAFAPLAGQAEWDCSGWQIVPDGRLDAPCTGALVCVDATGPIIEEAARRGFNLVVAHHPLLFGGLKSLTGATRQERDAMLALKLGVAVYGAHTSLDCAPGGVSAEMARRLGLEDVRVLDPESGLGAIGSLPQPMEPEELAAWVAARLQSGPVRMSRPEARLRQAPVKCLAMCGGTGGSLVKKAIAQGADAWLSSDISHHAFVDLAPDLLLLDISHHQAEACARRLIADAISQKLANFAVAEAQSEACPTINF